MLAVGAWPAPAAGTCSPSAGKVHDRQHVSRLSVTNRPGPGPGPRAGSGSGPGPGPHPRSVVAVGSEGMSAASLVIPRFLIPPGHCQVAPESLSLTQECGTSLWGVWVLKGGPRSYELPAHSDDVGVVWESRPGYETAWATPGHVCLCSCSYGHGAVRPQANSSV